MMQIQLGITLVYSTQKSYNPYKFHLFHSFDFVMWLQNLDHDGTKTSSHRECDGIRVVIL